MGPVWEEMIAERLRGCHNAHTNMSHIRHAFLPASKRAFVTKKKKKKILIIKATPADLCAFAAHPDTMDIRGSACHQAQVMQRGREGRGMGFLLFFPKPSSFLYLFFHAIHHFSYIFSTPSAPSSPKMQGSHESPDKAGTNVGLCR